ncbi:uncharacterized protein RJT20DRAFT_48448 [Scheffersomyces xylosifermentans]|uniref:uncharacterized protein n=1 Tax=Scheffersomyces xylosifermentans TaxID=1304137 RepID=UPI00315CBF6B
MLLIPETPAYHSDGLRSKRPIPSVVVSEVASEDIHYENAEDMKWNILPSYSLYKSIIHKGLKLVNIPPPPPYDATPPYLNPLNTLHATDSQSSLESVTILNNLETIHNLNVVEMSVHLSEPTKFEYRPHETISGYISLKNKKKFPVSFTMIYILFEGGIHLDGKFQKKFLSMIDMKSFLSNTDETILAPQKPYRRSFHFKIPEYLLDSSCEQVNQHLSLPPSLNGERDLALMNGTVKYTISSHLISHNAKEYLKVGYVEQPVRVIPIYESAPSETFNFEFIVEKLRKELIWYNKLRFDQLLKLLELQKSTCLKFYYRKSQVKLEIPNRNEPVSIKYVPPIPNHPDILQPIRTTLTFSVVKGTSLPRIKAISAEIIAVTLKSQAKVPIIISDEMIFESFSNKTYSDLVEKPMRKVLGEIMKFSAIQLTPEMSIAMRKLYNMSVKYAPLTIDDVKMNTTDSEQSRTYGISLNLKSMHIKKLDRAIILNKFGGFCLAPNFQHCNLIRKYYLKLKLELDSSYDLTTEGPHIVGNNIINVNIPLTIRQ